MDRPRHIWTKAETVRLVALRAAGLSTQQVADELGVSFRAVECRVYNARLPLVRAKKHRWTEAQVRQLIDLRAKGLTLRQVADQMGLPYTVVQRKVSNANLPLKRTKNHKWTEAQVQQLIDLRAKGLSNQQVADQMGLPYTVVKRKVSNARLPRRRYTFINLNVERSEKIQRYYSLIPVKTLCMSLDISLPTLYKALDKLHIKRKYKSWNR